MKILLRFWDISLDICMYEIYWCKTKLIFRVFNRLCYAWHFIVVSFHFSIDHQDLTHLNTNEWHSLRMVKWFTSGNHSLSIISTLHIYLWYFCQSLFKLCVSISGKCLGYYKRHTNGYSMHSRGVASAEYISLSWPSYMYFHAASDWHLKETISQKLHRHPESPHRLSHIKEPIERNTVIQMKKLQTWTHWPYRTLGTHLRSKIFNSLRPSDAYMRR